MKELLGILDSRKGLFVPTELAVADTVCSESAESECCDTNCGECDC